MLPLYHNFSRANETFAHFSSPAKAFALFNGPTLRAPSGSADFYCVMQDALLVKAAKSH